MTAVAGVGVAADAATAVDAAAAAHVIADAASAKLLPLLLLCL